MIKWRESGECYVQAHLVRGATQWISWFETFEIKNPPSGYTVKEVFPHTVMQRTEDGLQHIANETTRRLTRTLRGQHVLSA